MRTKTFALAFLSMFLLAAFLSFTSATTSSVFDITNISAPTSVSEDAGSFTFTFTLTYTGASSSADFSFADSTTNIGTISIPNANGMNGGVDESRVITGTISNFNGQAGKTMNVVINATTGSSRDDEKTFSVSIVPAEEYSLYDEENNGKLEVKNLEFDVVDGFGDDEDYWYPFDSVEAQFDVENNGDWDIKNIEITACLYDEDRDKCILDEGDMEISKDKFDLDSGDDDSVTLSFTVDADKLRAGNTDYKLYVAAAGEIDDRDTTYNKDKTGMQTDKEIEIVTDDDFVIVSNIELTPSTVSCGKSVEITADVWNVGDTDLDNDEVYLNIYIKNLGISKQITFDKGINAMDKESISYTLEIPEDAEEGTYPLEFGVYDDEDMSDNDVFENREGDEAIFTGKYFVISGNCAIDAPAVSADMISPEVKAGEDVQIAVTLTNNDEKTQTFLVSAEEFSSWATLKETNPSSITLASGESEEVYLTFELKDNSEGDQNFNLIVTSNNKIVAKQPVSITVEKGNFLNGIFDNLDWKIVLIAGLNIILLVAITIVASRVMKKN